MGTGKASAPISFEKAIARLARHDRPALIGIDGLPLSGKSTLAEMIARTFDAQIIALDDFVLPEVQWPSDLSPAFPFEYIRYNEFVAAVRSLGTHGNCRYYPFDWDSLEISRTERVIELDRMIVVEGVSTLVPSLCDLYTMRIFVRSDPSTTIEAALARGVGSWETAWRNVFLPSVELYMASLPETRADIIAAGRGILPSAS